MKVQWVAAIPRATLKRVLVHSSKSGGGINRARLIASMLSLILVRVRMSVISYLSASFGISSVGVLDDVLIFI
jgi:hypothetical protein